MKNWTRILVAFLLARSGAALAADDFEALTNRIVLLRCHMGGCGWYRIDESKLVGRSDKGALYELAVKFWNSKDTGKTTPPKKLENEESDTQFVFCSKVKPALIWKDEGKWVASPLEPGNEAAMAGATESAYAMYWAACHRAAVADVYSGGTRLARKLGYEFSGNAIPQDAPLSAPADVLKW